MGLSHRYFVHHCRPVGTFPPPPLVPLALAFGHRVALILPLFRDPGPNLVLIAARYSTLLFLNSRAHCNSHYIQTYLTPLENIFCLQLLCPPDFTGYPLCPIQSIHRFRSKTHFFKGGRVASSGNLHRVEKFPQGACGGKANIGMTSKGHIGQSKLMPFPKHARNRLRGRVSAPRGTSVWALQHCTLVTCCSPHNPPTSLNCL